MKKINYLFKNADSKTRIMGIVAFAIAAVMLVMLIISANTVLNGSMTKFPILKPFESEIQLDKFEADYEDFIEELEDVIEEDNEYALERIEQEYGMPAEEMLDLLDPLSLNGMKKLAVVTDENEEVTMIFSVMVTAITAVAFIIGLFLVLGGLFMKKSLVILADIFSIGFFLTFVGVASFAIFTVLCIAYCIVVSSVNRAYKMHKNAPPVTVDVAVAVENGNESAVDGAVENDNEIVNEDQNETL